MLLLLLQLLLWQTLLYKDSPNIYEIRIYKPEQLFELLFVTKDTKNQDDDVEDNNGYKALYRAVIKMFEAYKLLLHC